MKRTIATDGTIVQVKEGRTRDLALACAMLDADPFLATWHQIHYARCYGFYLPQLGIDALPQAAQEERAA